MKHLKDMNEIALKNKGLESSSVADLPNYHKLANHNELAEVAKKTEKIATAVYMITDLVGREDPLVFALRKTSITIMQTLFGTLALSQAAQAQALSSAMVELFELSSFLEVLHSNGKISDMNQRLLTDELQMLNRRIGVLTTKAMPYDRQRRSSRVIEEFTFTDDFFTVDNNEVASVAKDFQPRQAPVDNIKSDVPSLKDIKPRVSLLKDMQHNLKDSVRDISIEKIKDTRNSIEKEKVSLSNSKPKTKSISPLLQKKNGRQENIIKILKQKKDAKIGDLTLLITEVNAKTIQRDLNDLVDQGLVVRHGDRRWSMYNLAY